MCKATPARLHSTSVWKRHGLVRTLGRVVGAGRGVAQRDVGDGRGSGGISSEGMKGTLGSSQWYAGQVDRIVCLQQDCFTTVGRTASRPQKARTGAISHPDEATGCRLRRLAVEVRWTSVHIGHHKPMPKSKPRGVEAPRR